MATSKHSFIIREAPSCGEEQQEIIIMMQNKQAAQRSERERTRDRSLLTAGRVIYFFQFCHVKFMIPVRSVACKSHLKSNYKTFSHTSWIYLCSNCPFFLESICLLMAIWQPIIKKTYQIITLRMYVNLNCSLVSYFA